MRTAALFMTLSAAGCAGGVTGMVPVVPQNTGESSLAFHLTPGISQSGPILRVTVENRTGDTLCVRAEALRNPLTQEMMLYLRDMRGRELQWRDPGFIPPPIEGVVRIGPGNTATGEYYLRGRFVQRHGSDEIRQGWSARAAVRYGQCDNATSHWAMSSWQRI